MAYKQNPRTTMPESIRYNIKKEKREIDYTPMDPEVVDLCKAINSLPGLITTESCCGHGESTFRIWFKVDATPLSRFNENSCMQGLFFLTRCVDNRYFEFGPDWSISLSVSDTYDVRGLYPTMFLLECSSKGKEAYGLANSLHKNMIYHLNHKNFKNGFALNMEDFNVSNEDGIFKFNA